MMSYKSEYADTATIGVFPISPAECGYAHRLFRDLRDRGYQVFFEPEAKTTLTIIAGWTDEFGWNIQYNSRVKSETFRSLDHFYQTLRSYFILANQSLIPSGLVRPF